MACPEVACSPYSHCSFQQRHKDDQIEDIRAIKLHLLLFSICSYASCMSAEGNTCGVSSFFVTIPTENLHFQAGNKMSTLLMGTPP